MKTVLIIAGSDSGAGAGIQADLKTCAARNVYATTAITALTAQNTLGVHGVFPIPEEFVAKQIDSVMNDIHSEVWKTGMLANKHIIETVARKVDAYRIQKLVVDPVMVSQGGDLLFAKDGRDVITDVLVKKAYVLTPNIPEAAFLTGLSITTVQDMKAAAEQLQEMGANFVVVKGGHMSGATAIDILYDGKTFTEFPSPMIQTKNTHGTGCTFASCIAAELAKGRTVYEAVSEAKNYISAAIKGGVGLGIGKGNGPVKHDA